MTRTRFSNVNAHKCLSLGMLFCRVFECLSLNTNECSNIRALTRGQCVDIDGQHGESPSLALLTLPQHHHTALQLHSKTHSTAKAVENECRE